MTEMLVKGRINFPLVSQEEQKMVDLIVLATSPKGIYLIDPIMGIMASSEWIELEILRKSPDFDLGKKYFPCLSFVKGNGNPVILSIARGDEGLILTLEKDRKTLSLSKGVTTITL